MDQKKIGSFLKELRKEKGFTQEQLAEKLNVAGRTVSRWETGSNMPDIALLIDIAELYDVDIREILDGERKSEKMDQNTKETLQKVADFADVEKQKLLKKVRIISIIGLASLIIALLMESYAANSSVPLYEVIKGVCFGFAVGTMIVSVLYTTGLLAIIKEKRRKDMRIVAIVCSSLVFICILIVAILSL